MASPFAMARALALSWPVAFAVSLAAQGPMATAVDTARARLDTAARTEPPSLGAGFKLSAYAEASYAFSTRAMGSTIVGHLYDRFSDQFTLNAVSLAVERPVAADRWDGGVRIDFLVGQNAPVLQSSGFNLGPNGDITQLYVTLNVPTGGGRGVQFKLGKMVTLLGVEVIETIVNPNWSEGNQFIYVENFTATGLEVGYKFGAHADAQVRISNGWDRVTSGPHKDVMARVGVSSGDRTSIGLVGYYGAQQDGSEAKRYGGNLVVKQQFGSLSLWLQGDYGREEANPALPNPSRDADWWAAGTWLAVDVATQFGVGARLDYLNDRQGFRTSAAFGLPAGGPRHTLWSAAGTLNVRSWPNLLVRPEVRYDHSNLTPFDGRADQWVFGLSMAYIY